MSVAIVGWWAAGMICAATLLESGYTDEILLFDKNPFLGAKVIISGWGRCNVTTWYYKKQDLQTKYPHGRSFLQHSIARFGPRKIRQRFEDHGVPLKQEDDMRVFPMSDNGHDIVWAFENLFVSYDNMKVLCSTRVTSLSQHAWWWFCIHTSSWEYIVDKVVLTTWWNAYRHTGSTGDWYAFAQSFGHTITPLWPSLTSFETENSLFHTLSWIALPESQIIINPQLSCVWPVLFTHFWITGPMIFAFSAHIAHQSLTKSAPYQIKLIPDTQKRYDQRLYLLREAVQKEPHKQINTFLRSYFPRRLVDVALEHADLPAELAFKYTTKEILVQLAQLFGNGIPLTLIARRNDDEFVTSWGVSLEQVDPSTMESKCCPWLYFWGEILDIDGVTWWYNLTASWATGAVAGEAAGGG